MMEKTRFQRLLISIWPSIYRVINDALYFLLKIIKRTVKLAIEQISPR